MTRKKAQQIQEPRPFLVMTERITWKSIATEPGKPACTLLIPAALEAFLRRRYKEHGPLIAYLAYLLGRAALYRAQGRLPEVKRVTAQVPGGVSRSAEVARADPRRAMDGAPLRGRRLGSDHDAHVRHSRPP